MVWEYEVIEGTRIILGDLDSPFTYADERLERIAIVSAVQVINEMDFDNTYVVDVSKCSITPDPADLTVVNPKDNIFMALVSLKAACLIVNADLKKYATLGGLMVKDGPSSLDTKMLFTNQLALAKRFAEDYNYLKFNYKSIRAGENMQVILTSTTNRSIYGDTSPISY